MPASLWRMAGFTSSLQTPAAPKSEVEVDNSQQNAEAGATQEVFTDSEPQNLVSESEVAQELLRPEETNVIQVAAVQQLEEVILAEQPVIVQQDEVVIAPKVVPKKTVKRKG